MNRRITLSWWQVDQADVYHKYSDIYDYSLCGKKHPPFMPSEYWKSRDQYDPDLCCEICQRVVLLEELGD